MKQYAILKPLLHQMYDGFSIFIDPLCAITGAVLNLDYMDPIKGRPADVKGVVLNSPIE